MNDANTQTSLFLQQWHDGDPNGLNSLLERHLPWIEAQVRQRLTQLLRKKGETCDYVQDILVQFLKHSPRFTLTNEAHFRAFLLRVVQNALHDKYDWFTARRRAISRERPLPSDTVLNLDPHQVSMRSPSQFVHQHDQEAWVRMGMELLEPDDREILILHQWDNLSFPEIGERLGISSNAARKRHKRAVLLLTKKIMVLRQGKLMDAL